MNTMMKMMLVLISLPFWIPSTNLLASAEADATANAVLRSMADEERTAFEEVAVALGYTSARAALLEATTYASPPVSRNRIKDFNGDHKATSDDVQLLLNFTRGNFAYTGDYHDLDVTGDYVIDQADAMLYLRFYTFSIMYPEVNCTPTAPGSGSAPQTAFESRTYLKHTFHANGTESDSQYTLYGDGSVSGLQEAALSQMAANINANYPEAFWESTAADKIVDGTLYGYARVQDTRIIRCGGSGFIVGEHTIVTNAHCVYSKGTGEFNTDFEGSAVCAFTYTSSGEPIEHRLTVKSYHIPKQYADGATSGSKAYIHEYRNSFDYAIIVVQEDLSDYGCFDLGVTLDNAGEHGVSFTLEGFPQMYPCYPSLNQSGQHRVYTVGCTANLIAMPTPTEQTDASVRYLNNNYRLRSNLYGHSGASGSAWFTTNNESVIGIHTSSNADQVDKNASIEPRGWSVRIIQPILRFIYQNPYLN